MERNRSYFQTNRNSDRRRRDQGYDDFYQRGSGPGYSSRDYHQDEDWSRRSQDRDFDQRYGFGAQPTRSRGTLGKEYAPPEWGREYGAEYGPEYGMEWGYGVGMGGEAGASREYFSDSYRGTDRDRGTRWEGSRDWGAYDHSRDDEGGRNISDRYIQSRGDQGSGLGRRTPLSSRDQQGGASTFGGRRFEPFEENRGYSRPASSSGRGDYRSMKEREDNIEWSRDVRDFGGFGRESERNFRHEDHYGKGPKGYQRSSSRIEEEVCEALTYDSEIDATNIHVSVEKSEVTLTGAVKDRYSKRRAEELAESIRGVRDVQNQLKVDASLVEGHASSEASLSGQVEQSQGSPLTGPNSEKNKASNQASARH
jgi:osmotically-inducible protein OsmY